jgi:hypothetical protein
MRTARARHERFTPRQRPIVYKAPKVGGALIDEQLPRYDVRDAYQVVVVAAAEAVYDAVARRDFLLGSLTRLGSFIPVAERPGGGEIVLGAIGRPWRSDCGPVRIAASDFASFRAPGFAKIAWSWIVKPLGSGQSLLVVEWRAHLTDYEARADFQRFWTGVSRAVQRLGRVAVAQIKEECERTSTMTHTSS